MDLRTIEKAAEEQTAAVQDQTFSELARLMRQLKKQVQKLQEEKGRAQEANKKPLQCWLCEGQGHVCWDCFSEKLQNRRMARASTAGPTTACTKVTNCFFWHKIFDGALAKVHCDGLSNRPSVKGVLPWGTTIRESRESNKELRWRKSDFVTLADVAVKKLRS